MISREEVSHLWPFYFYKFMRGVLFLTTITLFIFLTEKGLSYAQGAALVALSQLAIIISELVTGSVADTFGRKKSVVTSLCIDSILILGVALTNSFWSLAIIFMLWGVSATLASGADSAWAIDSLIQKKREHLLDSYYAKGKSFFNAGMIVAGILSTSILLFSTNQTLWFVRVFLTFSLAIVLALFAKEKFVKKNEVPTIITTLDKAKEAVAIFRRSTVLFRMGTAMFFAFLAVYLAESVAVQDYKLQAGIPLEWWGVLFVIATFVGIFIPHLGMYVANKFKHTKNFLAISYIGLAVLYGVSHLSLNLFYVAIVTMLYRILNDFYVPVEEKLYNKHTPSSHRASVNSVKSMIEATGVLVGMVGAGFLVDMYGGAITISLAAIVVIPTVVILFGIDEKKVRKA